MEKIAGRAGETLVETLVGLLIGCIALLTLVSMMATSSKLIDRGEVLMEGYTGGTRALVVQEDAAGSDGTLVFSCGGLDRISLPSDGTYAGGGYSIRYYTNAGVGGAGDVISYRLK